MLIVRQQRRRLVAAMSSDYAWRSDVGPEASYGPITCQMKNGYFYLQKHTSGSTFPGSLLSKRQLGDSGPDTVPPGNCPIVRRSVLLSGVIERSKDTVISTLPLALITRQNVMISSSVGTDQYVLVVGRMCPWVEVW
jgi:hypothetical protein